MAPAKHASSARGDRPAWVPRHRKYYGTVFAMRITALMFVTMVRAALVVDGIARASLWRTLSETTVPT
jgi:hypothetical protein